MFDKIEKYVVIDKERYKINWSQSKTNGNVFYDTSFGAENEEDLFNKSERILSRLNDIANTFNKENTDAVDESKKKK